MKAWGVSGAASSLAPQRPTLRNVDLRGAPVRERRTPDLQSVRALTGVNPSPSASPGNRSRWGGADLSYKRGERANAREHSTDAELKVPLQGPTVMPKYCSSILPGPDRFVLTVPPCLGGYVNNVSRSLRTWEDKSRYGATEAGRGPSPGDGKLIRAQFKPIPGVPFRASLGCCSR